MTNFLKVAIASTAMLGSVVAPISAVAQHNSDHRQNTKNTWRNIAIGSGALGVLGLLKGDSTLMFAGAAGALYSASRYEHDRKSQSARDRARASYFRRTSYRRNGHLYVRKTVWQHGSKYYRFVRAS